MKKVSAYETFANEGVRTKMTPISSEDMVRKIGNLSGYRLADFVHRAITSHDQELIGNIIKYADIGSLNNLELVGVIDSAMIFDERDVLRYCLDKGLAGDVLDEILKSAYRFADYKSANLIRRYMRANESLRDKMTPKSKAEIEERIDGMGIKSVPFREIIRACSEMYESVSMKRINDHSFRYTFRENGLLYTVACWHLSTHGKDNYKMKLIVTEGRHRPENIFDISCMDDVMKIVRKGKEVIRNSEFERERARFFGVNEGVRDMMTPKSEEEIENSMKDITLYRAGKLYSSMVVRTTGRVSDKMLKHLPLIIKCHQEVFFDTKLVVDKYLKEGWKYNDYKRQTEPEDMLKLSFEVTVKRNKKKILVSQHKNNNYLHCSFINPATNKLDITTLRTVRDFKKLLNEMVFLNESLRDKMTSTSVDDIKDRISHMKQSELYELLWKAALEEDVETLKFYFDLGLDINMKNNRSETLLMDFVRTNYYQAVRMLLDLGADLNIGNDNGYTALVIATFKDSGAIVKLLLSNDRFNPKVHDQLNRALRIARNKFEYVERELNAYKVRMINEGVRDKMTPKGESDIREYVATLTQHEKDVKLLEVCLKQHMDWVKVLLAMGANPNYIHIKDGNTLIFRVCMGGIVSHPDLNIVRMLLEAGADPTVPNCRGIDTLKWAKCWKKWDIVELIEPYYNKGVSESVRDRMTPKPEDDVLRGIKNLPIWKRYDAIKQYNMTDHFSKEEMEEYYREQPPDQLIRAAVKKRDFQSMEKALKYDPNVIIYVVQDFYGYARGGDTEMVKFLIDKGIDIHHDGEVALQLATIDGRTEVVRLLLEVGARPTSNILEIALNKQDYIPEIVELLFKYSTPDVINEIQRWGYNYRGEHRHKDAYPLLDEGIRDKMTPKSEKQGLEEFRKLDKSDMVNSLYSECIEMFDPDPPMDSTPVVTDSFCEFLKKEVGFDIWTTFLPEYRKYINYDMVLDDLTEEQLIRLFQLIYDRKINESLRNKMTPKRVDDIRDSLGKLSKDQLNDRLVRAVTGNDLETLEVLLPHVDLNYEGQALELFELAIDLYHMGVFGLLLDKDHSMETIEYVRDYIDSHFGDSPTHRRMWLGLLKKYEGKTRVSE